MNNQESVSVLNKRVTLSSPSSMLRQGAYNALTRALEHTFALFQGKHEEVD